MTFRRLNVIEFSSWSGWVIFLMIVGNGWWPLFTYYPSFPSSMLTELVSGWFTDAFPNYLGLGNLVYVLTYIFIGGIWFVGVADALYWVKRKITKAKTENGSA